MDAREAELAIQTIQAYARSEAMKDEKLQRAWERIHELEAGLKMAYDTIKSLPIDCMGDGRDGELVWPIRDEVLHNIAAALKGTADG